MATAEKKPRENKCERCGQIVALVHEDRHNREHEKDAEKLKRWVGEPSSQERQA